MHAGHPLILTMIPIFLEGCCFRNNNIAVGTNGSYHYKALTGEVFMMQCGSLNNGIISWHRVDEVREKDNTCDGREGHRADSEEGVTFKGNSIWFSVIESRHSGNYTCCTGDGEKLYFQLEVLNRSSLNCVKNPGESRVTLILGKGGIIPCPGLNCSGHGSSVTWYKGTRKASDLLRTRSLCQDGNQQLILCIVYDSDGNDMYFCDRQVQHKGTLWTTRRAVNATVIPSNTKDRPQIMSPFENETKEVELGQNDTLICTVTFGFERNFNPIVQWWSGNHDYPEDMVLMNTDPQEERRLSIKATEVTVKAVIPEVTSQHLSSTFTCVASNGVGNTSASLVLRRKISVSWSASMVGFPVGSVLLVTGMAVILRLRWMEIMLFYRTRHTETQIVDDGKRFDVFVSFLPGPIFMEGLERISSPPDDTVEMGAVTAGSSGVDLLTAQEHQGPSYTSLEVVLPKVLEDEWGYSLCLLERDLLPGGAYTEDVADIVQSSRMVICLLSDDYLSNSSSVFQLESGIKALLQDAHLRLLLIWTQNRPPSLGSIDPPLPLLVRRALRVLPSLDWTSGSETARSQFWSTLRKMMPSQRTMDTQLTHTETQDFL